MFFIVAGQEKCPARSEIEYKVTEKPRHSAGFPAMFCVFLDVHQLFYGVHHLQRRASTHEYNRTFSFSHMSKSQTCLDYTMARKRRKKSKNMEKVYLAALYVIVHIKDAQVYELWGESFLHWWWSIKYRAFSVTNM